MWGGWCWRFVFLLWTFCVTGTNSISSPESSRRGTWPLHPPCTGFNLFSAAGSFCWSADSARPYTVSQGSDTVLPKEAKKKKKVSSNPNAISETQNLEIRLKKSVTQTKACPWKWRWETENWASVFLPGRWKNCERRGRKQMLITACPLFYSHSCCHIKTEHHTCH